MKRPRKESRGRRGLWHSDLSGRGTHRNQKRETRKQWSEREGKTKRLSHTELRGGGRSTMLNATEVGPYRG